MCRAVSCTWDQLLIRLRACRTRMGVRVSEQVGSRMMVWCLAPHLLVQRARLVDVQDAVRHLQLLQLGGQHQGPLPTPAIPVVTHAGAQRVDQPR